MTAANEKAANAQRIEGVAVEAREVRFAYGEWEVLRGVSFDARPGEVLSVLGANGVGKSTLFRCMLGLLPTYEGAVRVGGDEVRTLSPKVMASRIAYIPQAHYPTFNYSVFDTVLMGASHHLPLAAMPGEAEKARAWAAIAQMGIEHLAARGYASLSGGERQLTLMARALSQGTPVLLMDEPTANLDFGNQLKVLAKSRELARAGYTVILSTHNPEQSFPFSDRLLALKDGKTLAAGKPADILTDALLREIYGMDVHVESLYNDRVRVCVPGMLLEGE